MLYFETSAKTGYNVERAFVTAITIAMQRSFGMDMPCKESKGGRSMFGNIGCWR